MVKCTDCRKGISEDSVVYCDMCNAPLCEECGITGICSKCTELWESEIDLEDMYYEDIESEDL